MTMTCSGPEGFSANCMNRQKTVNACLDLSSPNQQLVQRDSDHDMNATITINSIAALSSKYVSRDTVKINAICTNLSRQSFNLGTSSKSVKNSYSFAQSIQPSASNSPVKKRAAAAMFRQQNVMTPQDSNAVSKSLGLTYQTVQRQMIPQPYLSLTQANSRGINQYAKATKGIQQFPVTQKADLTTPKKPGAIGMQLAQPGSDKRTQLLNNNKTHKKTNTAIIKQPALFGNTTQMRPIQERVTGLQGAHKNLDLYLKQKYNGILSKQREGSFCSSGSHKGNIVGANGTINVDGSFDMLLDSFNKVANTAQTTKNYYKMTANTGTGIKRTNTTKCLNLSKAKMGQVEAISTKRFSNALNSGKKPNKRDTFVPATQKLTIDFRKHPTTQHFALDSNSVSSTRHNTKNYQLTLQQQPALFSNKSPEAASGLTKKTPFSQTQIGQMPQGQIIQTMNHNENRFQTTNYQFKGKMKRQYSHDQLRYGNQNNGQQTCSNHQRPRSSQMKRTFCNSMSSNNLLAVLAGNNEQRINHIAKSFVTGASSNLHQNPIVFEYGMAITPNNRDTRTAVQTATDEHTDFQHPMQIYGGSANDMIGENLQNEENVAVSQELRFQEIEGTDEELNGPSNYRDQILRSPSTKLTNIQNQMAYSQGGASTKAFGKSPSVCVNSVKQFINPEYYIKPDCHKQRDNSPIKIMNDDNLDQSFSSQHVPSQKAFCQTVATQPAPVFETLGKNTFQQYIEIVKREREDRSVGRRESNNMSRTSFIRPGTANDYNSLTSKNATTIKNQQALALALKKSQPERSTAAGDSVSEYGAFNFTSIGEYRLGKVLGQGAYAVVKEGIHKTTGDSLAIKVYDKYKLIDIQRKRSVIREIKILKKLFHQNIVQLHDAIDTQRVLYLVMENVEGPSLQQYLKNQPNRKLQERDAARIFSELMSAIEYIHAQDIAHRDIKLENILIEDRKEKLKLIDFGFCCCSKEKLKVFCGTPSYMSPEIVSKREYFGNGADIWACGVLLYVLLQGCFPFKSSFEKDLFRKIQRGQFGYSSQISDEARNLIQWILAVDPNKRPSATEILTHEWFTINGVGRGGVYQVDMNSSGNSQEDSLNRRQCQASTGDEAKSSLLSSSEKDQHSLENSKAASKQVSHVQLKIMKDTKQIIDMTRKVAQFGKMTSLKTSPLKKNKH